MKSLQDILDEFQDQHRQEDAELLAEVQEARAELDALLQRVASNMDHIIHGPHNTWTT
jgi:hypothetical protein